MEEIRSLQREDQGDCGMHAGDMMMQGVWWHASVLPCLWFNQFGPAFSGDCERWKWSKLAIEVLMERRDFLCTTAYSTQHACCCRYERRSRRPDRQAPKD